MLIKASENLASAVENISVDKVLPPVFDKSVVEKVSEAIK
jgi:malic enzyme